MPSVEQQQQQQQPQPQPQQQQQQQQNLDDNVDAVMQASISPTPRACDSPNQANGQEQQDEHTVIVFDWDDTLLASSHLHSKGYRLDSDHDFTEAIEQGLAELEKSVITVVERALQHGEVHIITNAETGWVQLSAKKFLPRVVPLLEKVTVLSARSTYEGDFPDAPLKWKYHAFLHRLEPAFNLDRQRNIISFGDSHVEREAVRAVAQGRHMTKTKSIKFAERPTLEQLQRQLELVINCFDYIHTHDGDLDLMLTISLAA